VKADFFHVSAGIPPPLTLSTREKVLVKVNVVDTDAGRLDGCRRVGGDAAAAAATIGVSWS
jgi:hypothetical protein